ncbi:MAG: hypothetical protein ABSH39_01220 [Candidatus Acidiferrum sp.]|jgi:cell division protein FtsX
MNRNVWATLLAAVAVIVVLILGFRFLGSPSKQRLVRADYKNVQALASLAQQINSAWDKSEKALPDDLDKINGVVKKDVLTGKPFLYHPKKHSEYELCATFATDSHELPNTNADDPWRHPKGDYCFQLDAAKPVPQAPYNFYD